MATHQPDVTQNEPVDPVVVPDVATQPHPVATIDPSINKSVRGDGKLQDVVPELKGLAQKVGGFDKLADIAKALGDAGQ